MFEKNLKIAYLLDFYGELLGERVSMLLEAYYGRDLSLAEIAEGEGISRQGVRQALKKAEEELFFFEEKLHLAENHRRLSEEKERLAQQSRALLRHPEEEVRELAEAALSFLSSLN